MIPRPTDDLYDVYTHEAVRPRPHPWFTSFLQPRQPSVRPFWAMPVCHDCGGARCTKISPLPSLAIRAPGKPRVGTSERCVPSCVYHVLHDVWDAYVPGVSAPRTGADRRTPYPLRGCRLPSGVLESGGVGEESTLTPTRATTTWWSSSRGPTRASPLQESTTSRLGGSHTHPGSGGADRRPLGLKDPN